MTTHHAITDTLFAPPRPRKAWTGLAALTLAGALAITGGVAAAQAAAPVAPDAHSTTASPLVTATKKTPIVKVGLARTWQYRGSSLATKTTVTDGATKLGGKVVLYAGKKKVKTFTLKNGVARYTLSKTWTKKQKAGRYTLTFKYQPTGSAKYKYKAISKKRVLTLKNPSKKKTPTIKASLSHSWMFRGLGLDTKTTVKYGKTKLSGRVVIYNGKKKVKTLTLKKGVANFVLTGAWTKKQKAGKHTLTFKYLPTGRYATKFKSVSTKRVLKLETRRATSGGPTVAQVRKWLAPFNTGTENCAPSLALGGGWASDTGKRGWESAGRMWQNAVAPVRIKIIVSKGPRDTVKAEPFSCPTDAQFQAMIQNYLESQRS